MQVKFLKSATRLEDIPADDKPQVALVGRSNVGKSSLINHLADQKDLARVSAVPGRTRTINFFDVDGRYYLVDLPGYGYAKASKDKRQDYFEMLDGYLGLVKQLKLVLLIIDARIGLTDSDQEMLNYLSSAGTPLVMILNKVDKITHQQTADLLSVLKAAYPEIKPMLHSSVSKKGRNEILGTIEEKVYGPRQRHHTF